MRHYTHFSTEERELSRVLKSQGLSIRAIARMLNPWDFKTLDNSRSSVLK